ncbi:hypothetical protein [Ideonella sp. A 288]|uniref:hypothetical protein n=1 Tax=Ideonella sp. A 288 TaxID=1962181 RepID=UPI000B4B4A7B|nr:hypothetical protein [Ideonella sp. A 288]
MSARVLPLRIDADPVSTQAPDFEAGLQTALVRDITLMFRPLGVEAFRAFAIDIATMSCTTAWLISEHGEVTDDQPDRHLDSVFPGATLTLAQLAKAGPDDTVVHKLSHRRWVFAWRVDELHGVIAEVRYLEGRDTPAELDRALVRLICDAGMRGGHRTGGPDSGIGAVAWPQIDRRSPQGAARGTWAGLVLLALGALSALLIALVAIPQAREVAGTAQAELLRLRDMAELTMKRELSLNLAAGDYGEVQETLSGYASLGYFHGAVVTNAKQRIVSLAGQVPGLQVGAEVPENIARTARPIDLALGSEGFGRLLLLPPAGPTADDADGGLRNVRVLGGVAGVATLGGALLLAWPLLQRLRRRSPARG